MVKLKQALELWMQVTIEPKGKAQTEGQNVNQKEGNTLLYTRLEVELGNDTGHEWRNGEHRFISSCLISKTVCKSYMLSSCLFQTQLEPGMGNEAEKRDSSSVSGSAFDFDRDSGAGPASAPYPFLMERTTERTGYF